MKSFCRRCCTEIEIYDSKVTLDINTDSSEDQRWIAWDCADVFWWWCYVKWQCSRQFFWILDMCVKHVHLKSILGRYSRSTRDDRSSQQCWNIQSGWGHLFNSQRVRDPVVVVVDDSSCVFVVRHSHPGLLMTDSVSLYFAMMQPPTVPDTDKHLELAV